MKKQVLATKSPRQRRTRQEWQAIMAAYESSGLTQEVYCERSGVAPSSFARWRNLLKEEIPIRNQPLEQTSFVELPWQHLVPAVSQWDIELDLGNGMALRLRKN